MDFLNQNLLPHTDPGRIRIYLIFLNNKMDDFSRTHLRLMKSIEVRFLGTASYSDGRVSEGSFYPK